MRDPLAWVSFKYKLPLAFLCICLVAFGVGGAVVTSTAKEALERQIRLRLDEQAAATTLVVDRHLDLVGRRVEDFASDGFIRSQFEALLGGSAEAGPALEQHLRENKLALVDAFVDAALLDPDGEAMLYAYAPWAPPRESRRADATWFGPLRPANSNHDYPTFLLSTPLNSLRGDRRLGSLQLLVRADTWAAGMAELPTPPDSHVVLVDPAGRRLGLAGDPKPDPFSYTAPIKRNGWRLELGIDRAAALAPITALRNRYLAIGGVLLLVTACVVFFPVRFLVRPLGSIREAARRIAGGDFRARVAQESGDEIGELAGAFNTMAQAVEERTRKLEETADVLKRRERDIRFERDRLDAVIHSMQDGLFIFDRDGRITLSNAAAQPLVRALGTTGPERIDCGAVKPDAGDCLKCIADFSRPHRSCILAAESRVYEIHATTLSAPDGTTAGRLCVSRDVTDRVAETDRQAHQERMAVLGEIGAVMAHELNNPLAAIAMFGQILESQLPEGSQQRESAEVIRRNAETCKRTIRGLLDLAAPATPDVGEFDAHDLLDDVQRFLRPIYQRAGVAFRLEPRAEHATLAGDELQLRQVLVNLVMNAIQATEGNGGTVTVETADRDEVLEIRVRDDGPGIPADIRARVFDPFFTTKAAGTGTGLGLPTSRRIAEAHGGTLRLEETEAPGTVFVLAIPREGGAAWRTRTRLSRAVARERGRA